MSKWPGKIWTFIANASQAWQVWVWLAPAGALSSVTGFLTIAEGLPAYQIFIACVLVFTLTSVSVAAIFQSLVRYNEWVYRTSENGKLEFMGAYFNLEATWAPSGKPKYFKGVNIGVNFRNSAQFPIEFEFVSFVAVIEDRIAPTNDFFYPRKVMGEAIVGTHAGAIMIENLKKTDVKGRVEFEVKYGKPGKLVHTIKQNKEISLRINTATSRNPKLDCGIGVKDPL